MEDRGVREGENMSSIPELLGKCFEFIQVEILCCSELKKATGMVRWIEDTKIEVISIR